MSDDATRLIAMLVDIGPEEAARAAIERLLIR